MTTIRLPRELPLIRKIWLAPVDSRFTMAFLCQVLLEAAMLDQPTFLPEEPAKPPGAERRVTVRYVPSGSDTFAHMSAVVEGFSGTASVRNISVAGISLIVDHDLDPDAEVNLQLRNLSKLFSCRVPLRIIYMVERPSGEWILGGSFSRKLTDDEMIALLT
jgi:hypothetical protein